MKDLVQCRKLEAKFRQLAVSDPARRFLWLAEAEKWEREAEAEIASHFQWQVGPGKQLPRSKI
jgi:hypothetical protein